MKSQQLHTLITTKGESAYCKLFTASPFKLRRADLRQYKRYFKWLCETYEF